MPETETGITPQNSAKAVIDGIEYALDQLSEEARNQVYNLRATDLEINHIKQQLAICMTARATYATLLKRELPVIEAAQ